MRYVRCGAELMPDAKFCGVCWQVLGGDNSWQQPVYPPQVQQPQQPQQAPQGYSTERYRRAAAEFSGAVRETIKENKARRAAANSYVSNFKEVNRMPDGVALGTDERIIRQYQIGRFSFRQGATEVIVTNRRVIRIEE